MRATLVPAFLLVLALGCLGLAFIQDKKNPDKGDKDAAKMKEDEGKEEPRAPRLRGQLPMNYRKLSLSDEQTQKIYKIQAEYDDKIRELEDKIRKLKAEEKKAVEGVLTPGQKARLKEILEAKDK